MSAETLKWRREAIEAGVFHGLSGQAKAVWDHLATTYANEHGIAFPGAVLLAREMGLSERGLQRCMAELVQKGRIKKVSDAWRGHSTRYLVLPWSNSESQVRTSVHPSAEEGRTAVHPSGVDWAHIGVAVGHTAMRETGAPLCAISPKDPLIEPSPPSPPKAGGNGFFGKKTKANGEPGLPDHRNPSIDDALAAYEKLDGSNGIGRTDRIHFIAEIQFAKRKGMKDPIAWAIRTTKEGKFFSSPFDHEKAKEYLQELRGSH